MSSVKKNNLVIAEFPGRETGEPLPGVNPSGRLWSMLVSEGRATLSVRIRQLTS